MSVRVAGLVAALVAVGGCSSAATTNPSSIGRSRTLGIVTTPPAASASSTIGGTERSSPTYSPPSSSSLSPSAYRRASTELCNFEQERVYAAQSESHGGGGYPERFPSPEYAAYFHATMRITTDLLARLRRLPVPGGRSAEIEAYFRYLRSVLVELGHLETAAAGT